MYLVLASLLAALAPSTSITNKSLQLTHRTPPSEWLMGEKELSLDYEDDVELYELSIGELVSSPDRKNDEAVAQRISI